MDRTVPTYRFRSGALDHIMRSRNLTTDRQLAQLIGVDIENLPPLRAGAEVSMELALHVSIIQGDERYISGLFEKVEHRSNVA